MKQSGTKHVTVLMSVYNAFTTIENAVNSILRQTYQDWDLLIIDDHSIDGTYEVLLEIANQYPDKVSLLRNKKNIGLAASLNLGWKQSQGELIARMDADDECYPERLEKQVDFMQTHLNIDVLGTGAELIGSDGKVQNVIFLSEEHARIMKDVFKKTLFFHPSVMMRKSFLETLGGYDERLLRVQDFELWVKGIKYGAKYHNLQEVLLKYRTNNYQRSIKTIRSQFISQMIIAFRYRHIIKGLSWAFIGLLKRMLVHYGMYKPVSIRANACRCIVDKERL